MHKLWHAISKQLFRFGITGLVNTIIDFTVFNCLLYITDAKLPWQLAVINLMAIGMAATNSYIMNRYWTFAPGQPVVNHRVMTFMVATMIGIALNTMVVTMISAIAFRTNLPGYLVLNLGKLLGAVLGSVWNFLVYRHWVFANRQLDNHRLIPMSEQQSGLTSLIIPAYNEEARLHTRFEQLQPLLRTENFELVIVDDGSCDNTRWLAEQFAQSCPTNVRVAAHNHNQGKGAAVATGMAAAKGEYLIFSDADTTFTREHILQIDSHLRQGSPVVIGCRHHSNGQRMQGESKQRSIVGRAFNYLVQLLVLPGIGDTQCGLKGFSRSAAHNIFSYQRTPGFAFDVEILALARRLGYNIHSLEVSVIECAGSSVKCWPAALAMGFDLLKIRLNLSCNLYKLPCPANSFSWRWAVGLFAVALAARLPWLWEVPRYIDELSEVNLAFSIYLGKVLPLTNMAHDIGPLHNYILAAIFKLLGPSIYWPRLYIAITSALTVVLVYEIGRRRFNKWVGIIAAGLLLSNGMHIMVTHMAWSNSSTPFFFALALLTLILAEDKRSGIWLVAAAGMLAMVMQTHSSGVIYVMAAIAYMARPRFRRWMSLKWHWYLASLIIFGLGYGNMIYYNLISRGGSFSWITRKSYTLESEPGLVSYLENCGQMVIELLRSVGAVYSEPSAWNTWAIIVVMIIAVVLLFGIRQCKNHRQILPLYMILAAFAGIPWLNERYTFYLATRYIMPVIICTEIYLAVGAVELVNRIVLRWKDGIRRWQWDRLPAWKWPLRTAVVSIMVIGILGWQVLPFYRYCHQLTSTNESNRMALSILGIVSAADKEQRLVLLDSQLPLENQPLPYLLKLSQQPFIAVNTENSPIDWAKLKDKYPHRTIYAVMGSPIYTQINSQIQAAQVHELRTRVSIPTPSLEPRQVYVVRFQNP